MTQIYQTQNLFNNIYLYYGYNHNIYFSHLSKILWYQDTQLDELAPKEREKVVKDLISGNYPKRIISQTRISSKIREIEQKWLENERVKNEKKVNFLAESETNHELVTKIRLARNNLGMTQKEVESAINDPEITKFVINNIEAGYTTNQSKLEKITSFLGVNPTVKSSI